jgi:FtsP/CotA-like multicopper oxidase with cupredoxin domain
MRADWMATSRSCIGESSLYSHSSHRGAAVRVLPGIIAVVLLVSAPWKPQMGLPRITANDNRTPAGGLEDGVLTLHLEVVRGMWHPDGDADPGTDVLAFAETGRAPSIPGPLIRVPVGTEVRTTIRNALPDSSVLLVGLSGDRSLSDSVRLQPGEVRELVAQATSPGTFIYRALTSMRSTEVDQRYGDDQMLAGAFIVDGPDESRDRVLVLFQWLDSLRLKPAPGIVDEVLTINGKTWPHTERLEYDLGETIRWRVVNASFDVHPMHLHGSYFTVLARGGINHDDIYDDTRVRQVVTERLLPMSTMWMEWKPQRAGNWLFHCHLTFHIMPHPPLSELKTSSLDDRTDHSMHDMGGLVIGTTVHGPVAADAIGRRSIRLVVQQFDSVPGEFMPPFSYRFDDEKTLTVPGPPIVVNRNEPIAITVINRAKAPTSVHWHGLEIESYYDGVPGFGGDRGRTTPLVAVNDSFVVKMAPPRAGTFIYHSHADEARQQGGGLHGAFIVLEEGRQWDVERERLIIFADARDTAVLAINGEDHPTLSMNTGETYRLRLINITLAKPNMIVWLKKDGKVIDWNLVARDGADLPPHHAGMAPASLQVTIGQTYDALFTPQTAGEYILEARRGNGEMLRTATILVR